MYRVEIEEPYQPPIADFLSDKLARQVLEIAQKYEFCPLTQITINQLQDELNKLLRMYHIMREVPMISGKGIRELRVDGRVEPSGLGDSKFVGLAIYAECHDGSRIPVASAY